MSTIWPLLTYSDSPDTEKNIRIKYSPDNFFPFQIKCIHNNLLQFQYHDYWIKLPEPHNHVYIMTTCKRKTAFIRLQPLHTSSHSQMINFMDAEQLALNSDHFQFQSHLCKRASPLLKIAGEDCIIGR